MGNRGCQPLPTSLKECSFQFHGKCPVGSHRSRLKTLFSEKYLIETMPLTVKLRSRVYGRSRNRMVGLGPFPLRHRGRAEKQWSCKTERIWHWYDCVSPKVWLHANCRDEKTGMSLEQRNHATSLPHGICKITQDLKWLQYQWPQTHTKVCNSFQCQDT